MKIENKYKNEAIYRMKKLGLDQAVIYAYEQFNTVFCSCNGNLMPLTDFEKDIVKKYEKISKCPVYHVIHSFANIGETYELLYVSYYLEDWEWENNNIDSGYLLVRSENMTHPDWSESGSIIVENKNGSLFRIA